MQCILCGSTELDRIEIQKIDRIGYRCRSCHLEFLWPQPTDREISDLYHADYYRSWGISAGDEDRETARLKRATAGRYLRHTGRFAANGKLLDIGCAFGYALEAARMLGYEPYGVELSPFSSLVAQKKFGNHVIEGKIEDAPFKAHTFSVVTLFDLLEHVPDPILFMRSVRELIVPGGAVAITTPDTRSISRYLLGRGNWFHYKVEHLTYFNRHSLDRLAALSGFSVTEYGRAYKTMSLQYLCDQFRAFPQPAFTLIFRMIDRYAPQALKHLAFPVSGGELFAILTPIDHEI